MIGLGLGVWGLEPIDLVQVGGGCIHHWSIVSKDNMCTVYWLVNLCCLPVTPVACAVP